MPLLIAIGLVLSVTALALPLLLPEGHKGKHVTLTIYLLVFIASCIYHGTHKGLISDVGTEGAWLLGSFASATYAGFIALPIGIVYLIRYKRKI